MTKTINAYKLRTNLGEFLNEVFYKGNEIVIERRGKALAKIVPLESAKVRVKNLEDRKRALSGLVGALSDKRAEEMKELIYKNRKVPAKAIKI